MFKRNGERHKVKFNGIRVERTGAELFLREGRVVAKCKTPEIKLNPEKSINGNAFFMTDSILLDQEDFKINGYVRWEMPDSTLNEEKDTVKSNKTALKYNDFKLLGTAYFADEQRVSSTHLSKSQMNLNSNSRFFISGNKYSLYLTGTFKVPIQSRTSKQDTLSLPFKDQKKLSFFYKNTIQTDQQVKLAPDTSIMMNISDYVIDLSDNKSPKYHEDSLKWKGLYFENFKISARKDSTFSFKINEFLEFIDTSSLKKCHASLSDNDTIIDIQTTTDTLEGTYNSFPALYDKIQIEYLNDSLQWLVKGNINIPYLPDGERIIIKNKNNRIQLAKSMANSSFKVFPMYKYEFNEISASYADTIIHAQIDHQENNIELILPADFVDDNVKLDFDFKGRKIQLNNNNLVKGDSLYLSTYKDYNYSLVTHSLKNESTNYDFKIYIPREIYIKVKDQNTVSNSVGKVKGEGFYKYNSKATIKAIPKDDYVFKFWEDRNTGDVFSEEDSVSFKIKKDMPLIAYFSEKDEDTETNIRNQNIQGIKIYPNPTNGNVYLNSKDYKIDQLKILDITGKKVIIRRNLDKRTKIDISHLDNGIYLIQIKTDEGSTIRKIIKE
ncbi:MAG: T9SS type A sorting domain-containing protein [archaeon]